MRTKEDEMYCFSRSIALASLLLIIVVRVCIAGELLAPTRGLQDAGKEWGNLTVLSEPPGLAVFLDDSKIGHTPLWQEKIDLGFHKLRVKDSETELVIKKGKTLRMGLFKGSFITLPEEKREVLVDKPSKKTSKTVDLEKKQEHTENQKRGDLTLWEKYIDGSLPHF
jgi:hypothetical protein